MAQDTEGKLAEIYQVANGNKCGCICLVCGEPLIARNCGPKRKKHFAHQGNSSCGSTMTWLHRAAQMIIESSMIIGLPSGETFQYHSAKREATFEGFIADVLVIGEDRRIFIEIVVTNDLDPAKISKIKQTGIECLRIDLQDVCREIGLEKLKATVIGDPKIRKWVHELQESPSCLVFFDLPKDQSLANRRENEEQETKTSDRSNDPFMVFLWILFVYWVMRILIRSNEVPGSGYSGLRNTRRNRYRNH